MMFNRIILLLLISVLFSSCYSLKKSIESGKPYNDQINWTQAYALDKTEFYIHNKIEIDASAEIVWNILTKAEEWPNWYVGMKNVKVLSSEDGIVKDQADLSFNTMKRNFKAKVVEYQPYERLTWETVDDKMMGMHAWLIIPTEKGCLVVTDESQYGKLARLQKIFLPNKLRKLHDIWLQELKAKAESKTQID